MKLSIKWCLCVGKPAVPAGRLNGRSPCNVPCSVVLVCQIAVVTLPLLLPALVTMAELVTLVDLDTAVELITMASLVTAVELVTVVGLVAAVELVTIALRLRPTR